MYSSVVLHLCIKPTDPEVSYSCTLMCSRLPSMPAGSLKSQQDCVECCCISAGLWVAQMHVGALVGVLSICGSRNMT